MKKLVNVVALGGGGGLSQVLKALRMLPEVEVIRRYQELKITGIVGVADAGRSTGILRRLLGMSGYVGDLTKCLVALCKDEFLAEWLNYRFEEQDPHPGSLRGAGNLAVRRIAERHGWGRDQQKELWLRTLRRFYRLPDHICSGEILKEILSFPVTFHNLDGNQPATSLHPHSMKNLLFLACYMTLLKYRHDPDRDALKIFGSLCETESSSVIAVSDFPAELCVLTPRGCIRGEDKIDTLGERTEYSPYTHEILSVWLEPTLPWVRKIVISADAWQAITNADHVIIAPGSPISSTMQVLLPEGIREAFRILLERKEEPTVTLILNIMTCWGEAPRQHYARADQFIERIQRAIGRPITKIICDNSDLPRDILEQCRREKKMKLGVKWKDAGGYGRLKPYYCADSVIEAPVAGWEDDGRVFHDPRKLAAVLAEIFREDKVSLRPGAFTW